MKNLRLVTVTIAALLSLAAAHNQVATNPVSYNFLQVDGDETRIGINGPAAMAQIPLSNQQVIVLHGDPIASFRDSTGQEQGDLGLTDTIVEVTGAVPGPGSEAQLQFRLVALSLTGSFLDDTGEKWQVRVSLSKKRDQPPSTAVVRNNGGGSTGQGGGTFDSVLNLFPRFVFTRAGAQRIVDDPDRLAVRFVAANAEWSAVPPSGAVRPDLNGGFFAVQAVHGGEAGQHATKAAVMTALR